MTTLPGHGKFSFQGKLLGLKTSRLMAMACALPSYTEAKSRGNIQIVGDILNSSGKKQNEQSVGFILGWL